ncbi:hypothetical protein MYX82_03855 [Acidobacteria bacterium AH-259-D05]|nr:hypothetical protein [Acidobacteria bacterium AH-259-D05]
MSTNEYKTAQDCFAENWKTLPQPPAATEQEMQIWNLNNGLANLSVAIKKDMVGIKNLLGQILSQLQGSS